MTELQRLARCLADDYQFECQGGPLRNCTEWRALCAAIDTLAVDPPPSGASLKRRDPAASNPLNQVFTILRDLDMPEDVRITLAMDCAEQAILNESVVSLATGYAPDGRPLVNCVNHPQGDHEWACLACLGEPPDDSAPSGASPQAETLGDAVSALWRALCEGDGKHSEMLDRSIIATHLERYAAQKPALVSPVEPESSSFEANTASNLLQKVELSTLDRYRNTNQMDVDTWMVRAVASSEPRSEDDLVLLDHVIALLKPTVEPEPPTLEPCAHELDYHNCAECVGPKVEPEPCVWRGLPYVKTTCGQSRWVPVDLQPLVSSFNKCPYCGAPLKVER